MVLGKQFSGSQLGRELWANQQQQSDIIQLGYKGGEDIVTASKLTYIYAEEVVQYLKEMQARDGTDMANYISRKLEVVERDLAPVGFVEMGCFYSRCQVSGLGCRIGPRAQNIT